MYNLSSTVSLPPDLESNECPHKRSHWNSSGNLQLLWFASNPSQQKTVGGQNKNLFPGKKLFAAYFN